MLLYQYLPHGNQIIQFQLSGSPLLLLHFPVIIFLHLTVPPLSFLISSFPPHLFICLPWGRTGAEPQVIEVAAGWSSLAFKYPIPTSKHSPHWFYKWHKMFHRSRINIGAWRRFCTLPPFFPTARLPFHAKKLPLLAYIYSTTCMSQAVTDYLLMINTFTGDDVKWVTWQSWIHANCVSTLT